MDRLDEDLLHFRTILNKCNVQYIMVGGFAVHLYGYTRATNDVDLLLQGSASNRSSLAAAFAELGYKDISFKDLQFVTGWTNFDIGTGVHLEYDFPQRRGTFF